MKPPPSAARRATSIRVPSLPPPRVTPDRARNRAPERPLRRQVDGTDLDHVDSLAALLLTLNDPRASAAKVAHHVAKIEVLTARVADKFIQRKGPPLPRLVEQIALLGNRELESILLTFLEDVVTLHCATEGVDPAGEGP